jgi:hypothetical protein
MRGNKDHSPSSANTNIHSFYILYTHFARIPLLNVYGSMYVFHALHYKQDSKVDTPYCSVQNSARWSLQFINVTCVLLIAL